MNLIEFLMPGDFKMIVMDKLGHYHIIDRQWLRKEKIKKIYGRNKRVK